MPAIREIVQRVRFLLLRDRLSAELEEEMRFHVEQRAARLRASGAAPDDAGRAARRRFGNRATIEERSRDAWGGQWIEHAAADLRFAVRRMRRRPGFAAAVIVVAALGIGASAAVFSAIDATLIRPLPFLRPSELVTLSEVGIPFSESGPGAGAGPHFLDITDATRMRDLFTSVAAYAAGGLNVADTGHPRRVNVGVVTPSFFATLGVHVAKGRAFDESEGRPDGPHAAILSHAFWRAAFGGAEVLGRTLDLSGTSYTIVGIMEPGFNFPNESDLWVPMTVPTTMGTFAGFRGFIPSHVLARLAPGVTAAAASARLLDRWRALAGPHAIAKTNYLKQTIESLRAAGAVQPLRRQLVGTGGSALVMLLGATALLMLVACANIANLLLSDGAARRREIALREVLGATRTRIVRQLLIESLLLTIAGAALGLALSPAALRLLRALVPTNLAGVAAAGVNGRVLAFATALAVVTGLVFGLWPALASARSDPGTTIKAGATGGATAHRLGGARRALVTAELALSVMLLVGSGLMLRSLRQLLSESFMSNPERVGTLELSFAGGMERPQRLTRVRAMLARLAADPGIAAAGAINDVPLSREGGIGVSITVDGQPAPRSVDDIKYARYLMASRGYFDALGVRMLRGHTFDATTDSASPSVAVINESMARTYWPNQDPIGRAFHFGNAPTTIVGEIADIREHALADSAQPQMYFPIAQQTPQNLAIVARSTLPPSVLLARMVGAVRAVDPSQAVYNVRTMEDVVSTSVAPQRTNTMLIAAFGALALLLSAFGVYALLSYGVTQRARELGIRAALGASRPRLAALVGREMAALVVVGTGVGLAGAWALSRVMASLLFGVAAHDPVTFIAAPCALLVPVTIATAVPAWRAMHADPVDVMRAD